MDIFIEEFKESHDQDKAYQHVIVKSLSGNKKPNRLYTEIFSRRIAAGEIEEVAHKQTEAILVKKDCTHPKDIKNFLDMNDKRVARGHIDIITLMNDFNVFKKVKHVNEMQKFADIYDEIKKENKNMMNDEACLYATKVVKGKNPREAKAYVEYYIEGKNKYQSKVAIKLYANQVFSVLWSHGLKGVIKEEPIKEGVKKNVDKYIYEYKKLGNGDKKRKAVCASVAMNNCRFKGQRELYMEKYDSAISKGFSNKKAKIYAGEYTKRISYGDDQIRAEVCAFVNSWIYPLEELSKKREKEQKEQKRRLISIYDKKVEDGEKKEYAQLYVIKLVEYNPYKAQCYVDTYMKRKEKGDPDSRAHMYARLLVDRDMSIWRVFRQDMYAYDKKIEEGCTHEEAMKIILSEPFFLSKEMEQYRDQYQSELEGKKDKITEHINSLLALADYPLEKRDEYVNIYWSERREGWSKDYIHMYAIMRTKGFCREKAIHKAKEYRGLCQLLYYKRRKLGDDKIHAEAYMIKTLESKASFESYEKVALPQQVGCNWNKRGMLIFAEYPVETINQYLEYIKDFMRLVNYCSRYEREHAYAILKIKGYTDEQVEKYIDEYENMFKVLFNEKNNLWFNHIKAGAYVIKTLVDKKDLSITHHLVSSYEPT